MLFGKYHIVVFKERGGSHRNLLINGWIGVFCFVLFLAMGGANIWLFKHYQASQHLEQRLEEAEQTIGTQNTQLVSMTGKLRDLQADLTRVQEFDAKLRLMVNMEPEKVETRSSMGGARSEDFLQGYLPLHRQELMARKMNGFIKELATDVRLEEIRQQDLLVALHNNREMLASTPSIWPTKGFISSPFGFRKSPFTDKRQFHKGLDIAARSGTPILAPARGTVSFAGVDGAYGNSVMLRHGNGLATRYAHMQRFIVKKGQKVQRGDIIGYVGSSGRSTGAHLHYEVRVDGVCVNPMRYILN